jgi:hypothetical protein
MSLSMVSNTVGIKQFPSFDDAADDGGSGVLISPMNSAGGVDGSVGDENAGYSKFNDVQGSNLVIRTVSTASAAHNNYGRVSVSGLSPLHGALPSLSANSP